MSNTSTHPTTNAQGGTPMEITVERTPASEWSAERATVRVTLPSGRTAEVQAYGPQHRYGTLQPGQVNWSALGSVDAADAQAYAVAITLAAGLVYSMQPATGER